MRNLGKAWIAGAALLALSGCAALGGGGDKKNTPTIGQRVPILGIKSDDEVDPNLAGTPVVIPDAVANADWSQGGGNASKSMGHMALGASPARLWSGSIAGGSTSARLASTPVVANGRLYVVDIDGKVQAMDAVTGARIWASQIVTDKDGRPSAFGGGTAVEGNRVYATNGVGTVVALDTDTGALVWSVRPAGPLRGAPTVSNGNIYVMTQDNQIYALSQANGETQWSETASVGASGIFGVASPAAGQGSVIAGFSTGELTAYRYENGRNLWSDALSRTSISTSVSTLTDIDADPVIDRGRVYAVGQGGRMASYDLVSGQRIWEMNIAGITTPVVAGEWVFVLTDEAKLLCIARNTGRIRWISQLQRYKDVDDRKGPISWTGPVMAGGRLIVASTRGEVWSVSPGDGAASRMFELGGSISQPPIVANGILYIMDDNGKIAAFR